MVDNLKKNTLNVIITNISISGILLISSILLARLLGPTKQGYISIILVTVEIISKFIGLGSQSAASYFINNKKYNTNYIINNVLTITTVLSIVVSLLFVLIWPNSMASKSEYLSINPQVFTAVYLVFSFFRSNCTSLFSSIEKYTISNRANLITALLPCIIIILLAGLNKVNVNSILVSYLAVHLITIIYLLYSFNENKIKIHFQINFALIKEFFAYGLPIYLSVLVLFFQQRASFLLIAHYLGLSAVGYYTVAYNVSDRLNDLTNPLSVTHFPRAAQIHKNSAKESANFTVGLFAKLFALYLVIILPVLLMIKFFIPVLFSNAYLPSVAPALILVFYIMAMGLSRLLNNLLSINLNQYKNLSIISIGLLVNLSLIIYLINTFGIIGVAFANTISFLLITLMQIYVVRKEFNISYKKFMPDILGVKEIIFNSMFIKKIRGEV